MTNATNRQVGGNHYKDMAIQPMEYALKNGLNYAQANAVKYVTRYKSKGGIVDLRKAIHCIELLIEHEMQAESIDEMAFKHSPDFDESRIDIIAQNGNDAQHYEWQLHTMAETVIVDNGHYENGAGRTVRTSAPDGRYIRQDNGLYRLAEVQE